VEAVGQLTVGCSKGRLMIIAFSQREAVEAGQIAAWSGFALAAAGCVIQAWRLWRRAAALVAARFGGVGSAAVVVEASVLDLTPGTVLWLFARSTAARVLARNGDGQARLALLLGRLVTGSPSEPGMVRVFVDHRTHVAAAADLIFLYRSRGGDGSLGGGRSGRPTTAGAASHD
jgi:hypothetical protein